jgi:hypothetical protein
MPSGNTDNNKLRNPLFTAYATYKHFAPSMLA